MDALAVVIRVLHIGAGVIAAGAAFFQWYALHPALSKLSPEQRSAVRDPLLRRWFPLILTVIALLLLSGLLNFVAFKIPEYKEHPHKGVYHGLFGLKFLLALASFHFATVLALPGARGDRWRDKAHVWLAVQIALLSGVIVIGAVLRYFPTLFPR